MMLNLIPPWVIVAAAVAAVGAVQQLRIWSLKDDIKQQGDQITTLQAEKKLLEAANTKCSADVDRQNAAVAALLDKAQGASSDAAKAMATAQEIRAGFKATADELRKQIPSGDYIEDCQRLEANLDAEIARQTK